MRHFWKGGRATNTALEISLFLKILARTRFCVLQNSFFSSPRLILLFCCVYCNLGAIGSHSEYPFNSPMLITHVLPALWKRISKSHFFPRQRFPCLPFHHYISGSSFPPFYFSPGCPLSSVIAFKTDTTTLWSIKLMAFETIFSPVNHYDVPGMAGRGLSTSAAIQSCIPLCHSVPTLGFEVPSLVLLSL